MLVVSCVHISYYIMFRACADTEELHSWKNYILSGEKRLMFSEATNGFHLFAMKFSRELGEEAVTRADTNSSASV